ncbi:MAG TPA: chromosome segregation protein SMC [Bryobacteraceae bacterium]|nr:chromosome segregation protein SMC [Bryobacteraceae bacterium]HVW09545.1 chromosome segregation protein SMC [Bryobacteraceae bacterium]
MLKLKRVEIHGFKSFFDKTELRFNGSGIAAVVGPNGCGKSNLSDAMSWVLGEQSAKNLRGVRMEDVIFAGTGQKKPLGMASVTMTLMDPTVLPDSNAISDVPPLFKDGAASDEHQNGSQNGHQNGHRNGHQNGVAAANGIPVTAATPSKEREITITRRLYRSGESEYLINGRPARLRDIQDLFLGTGLGPESYAIIEQGRIGQILSNRPQDRRAVIEEAAGITKFKTRRRLAEAKLEGAKQNLSRVFDILEEVSRQVNSLKRQAAKAKRYEELKVEMVAHLRRALTGKFRMIEREAAKTALDLSQAQTVFQSLNDRVGSSEKEYAAAQEQCYRTEALLTEARAKLHECRLEEERTRGKLDYQSKQIASMETRLAQGETESATLEQRELQFRQELESALQSVAELEQQVQSGRERLAAKGAGREELQRSLQERNRTLEAGRQQILRLLGEASSLRNQVAKLDEYFAAIERDTTRARQEEASAVSEMQRLEQRKAELSESTSARQLQLASVMEERRSLEENLSVQRSQAAATRKKLEELRTAASGLQARHHSLSEVLSHRAYTAEGVKRLFTAIEKGGADFRPSGVLADFVEVEPSVEKAAEEFLHEELEYVVVNNWQEAGQGIQLLREDVDGRATFLVHPEAGSANHGAGRVEEIRSRAGVTGLLRDHVRLTNGLSDSPAGLLPRLGNCFLAADRDAAQSLATEFPDYYFLLPDGVSYHGHAVSGGKKTGSGPLQLKRELRELTRLMREKQAEVAAETESLNELDAGIAALAERLEAARATQQSQEKEVLALDHEARKLAEEFSRTQSRLSVSRLELDRLNKDRERSLEQRDRSQVLVEEKEQSRAAQEQALEQARAELEVLQADATRLSEEHSALRAEVAGLDERRRAAQSERARKEDQLREISRRREGLASEMARLGVERTRLLSDNVDLGGRAGELKTSIEKLTVEVEQLASSETAFRESVSALDESLKQLRAEAQAAQENRSQTELALVRLQAELKFLDETSRKELGVAAEELASGEEIVPDEVGLEESEAKYQEVRARIEALGAVNPDALQEFQEAQQRYDFLNAQRQDLLDSIRDTEKAIQEIDVETRKRFAEAFEAININFREMFTTLFSGGAAEMRLTDELNVNESGIDIVASPPGKKLQNVLLLSGGEKSLTAMALLMAIFRYQPSPFCILDEVDAPLDDPNIVRLTRLLQDMSSQTQFVVITHSKRTMEVAQALYGVTMQEPGVSKLVSVKFQPAGENGTHATSRRELVGARA